MSVQLNPVVIVNVEEYERLSDCAECPKEYAAKLYLRRQVVASDQRRQWLWEIVVFSTIAVVVAVLAKYVN